MLSGREERPRSVRERLEAAVSGLGELELLRQRQEELVRTALQLREEQEVDREEERRRRREAQLSSEEKLLEENILLLRKQLNCLRRRDAGLITQLQELDRQISELQLDASASHDPPETDSRPSSGFYELSDAASGSLSNSSNSVFSECFCSAADAEGRLLPTGSSSDDPAGCLDCDALVGGLCEDSPSSGTVRRSLSAPHPPAVDTATSLVSVDIQSKYRCDLVARSGGDLYRYPSPLHAVVVQSPVFLLGNGLGKEEAPAEGLRPETTSFLPQSSSWSASCSSPSSSSQTPSHHKRLDGYIFALLQRRSQPVRTSRPRTSISTEPSKSILRQASLCTRQFSGSTPGSGLGTLRVSELKPSWALSEDVTAASSPQRKWSVESKGEQQEAPKVSPSGPDAMLNGCNINSSDCSSPRGHGVQNGSSIANVDISTGILRKQSKGLPPHVAASTASPLKDCRDLGSPKVNYSPKQTKQPSRLTDQELLLRPPPLSDTPKNCPKPPQGAEWSVLDLPSVGSSSLSQDEGGGNRMAKTTRYVPAHHHKVRKGINKKTSKVKSAATPKTSRVSKCSEPPPERRADKSHHTPKTSHPQDNGGSTHRRGASSRMKRLPASIPEGQVLDKPATSTPGSIRSGVFKHHHHGNHRHHHHHGREQVVVAAKLKHKRSNYRRLRATMEVPYDEAFRRAQRRQRKELLSDTTATTATGGCLSSPYTYIARSDSEYSAECASLFHSTIVDTSEDETSNYTANRFGDSESSEEEVEEEEQSTSSTGGTEESGGGGAGGGARAWGQVGATGRGRRAAGQEGMMTPAQAKAFVKIKASHNLKKKILRFRSGSLKLMTTV